MSSEEYCTIVKEHEINMKGRIESEKCWIENWTKNTKQNYCEHMEEVEKENEASVEGQGMCEERTKTAVPTGQSQREEWTEENGRDGRVRCVFVFCVWRWYQETIICCDWKVKWYVWNKLALTVCWLCFVPFVSLSLSFSSFALLLWSSLWLSCLLLVSCFFL